jgi:hypothetical protein
MAETISQAAALKQQDECTKCLHINNIFPGAYGYEKCARFPEFCQYMDLLEAYHERRSGTIKRGQDLQLWK